MYTRWEEEVKSLNKGLKGKHSVGYDDIPECIVKQCIQLVKKPLHKFIMYLQILEFSLMSQK
jgi:hypothetical protein